MHDQGSDTPVFILGSPRSGTTWLGKIFDSHPRVRYIHEPEIAFPPDGVPVFTPDGDAYVDAMRDHIDRWLDRWHPRSRAKVPVFPKAYEAGWRGHPVAVHLGRSAYHALERGLGAGRFWPGVADTRAGVPVIKGVNLLGRVPAILAAYPEARIVHLVRHPGGQVASMLRRKGGGTGKRVAVSALPTSRSAHDHGLTQPYLDGCSDVARAAWHWLCFNEDVLALADSRIRSFAYDEMVTAPKAMLEAVFAFAGLDFSPQTHAFLERLRTGEHTDSRYSLSRDPHTALNRWRQELAPAEQAVIRDIVQSSRLVSTFGFDGWRSAGGDRS